MKGFQRSRGAGVLVAALTSSLFASRAHAAGSASSEDSEETQDRKTLSGLGTALNFRGAANEFDADTTYATSALRSPVEAMRLSARMLLLPAVGQATTWWGGWFGFRTAGLHFQRAGGSVDSTPDGFVPANLQPTIGLVVESTADEVRFEADVAPVISMSEDSQLASQAAAIAAISTAPHDDLLFVPNLRGGARLRLGLSRRFRFGQYASLSVGTEIETGYAKAATPIGTSQGGTGGGAVNVRLYLRPHHCIVEGFGIEGVGDLGYTSIWTEAVVLPMLLGGGFTVEIDRALEARLLASGFATNPIANGGGFRLDSWAMTAGLRWTFGKEPTQWTQRQVEMEPELGDQKSD